MTYKPLRPDDRRKRGEDARELQALMNNSKKRKQPMTVSDLLEVMRCEDVWVYRGNKELYHGQCEGIKQHVRVKTVTAVYVGRTKELVIEVSE